MKTETEDFTPDYKYWFAKDKWTEKEACFLLMGIDPIKAFQSEQHLRKAQWSYHFNIKETAKEMINSLSLLTGEWELRKKISAPEKEDPLDWGKDSLEQYFIISIKEGETKTYVFISTLEWTKHTYHKYIQMLCDEGYLFPQKLLDYLIGAGQSIKACAHSYIRNFFQEWCNPIIYPCWTFKQAIQLIQGEALINDYRRDLKDRINFFQRFIIKQDGKNLSIDKKSDDYWKIKEQVEELPCKCQSFLDLGNTCLIKYDSFKNTYDIFPVINSEVKYPRDLGELIQETMAVGDLQVYGKSNTDNIYQYKFKPSDIINWFLKLGVPIPCVLIEELRNASQATKKGRGRPTDSEIWNYIYQQLEERKHSKKMDSQINQEAKFLFESTKTRFPNNKKIPSANTIEDKIRKRYNELKNKND